MITKKIDNLLSIINSKPGLRSDERILFSDRLKEIKQYICCLPTCEYYDLEFIDENNNVLDIQTLIPCGEYNLEIGGCITIMNVDFEADFTTIDEGLDIQFTDLSNNNPTNWFWDFGDGNTSTLQNPIHSYASAGLYTVTLMAAKDGAGDIEIKEDYITITDPFAL